MTIKKSTSKSPQADAAPKAVRVNQAALMASRGYIQAKEASEKLGNDIATARSLDKLLG